MQNGRYILMRGASEPLAHFFAKIVGFKFRKNENDSSNKAWSENKTTPANFVFEASRTADANYAYASGHLLVCASRTPRGAVSGGAPWPLQVRGAAVVAALGVCGCASVLQPEPLAPTAPPILPCLRHLFLLFLPALPAESATGALTHATSAPPPRHSLSSGSHHVCDGTRAQSSSMKK